jgi:adenine deaminase
MIVIKGNLIDIFDNTIKFVSIEVKDDRIFNIEYLGPEKQGEKYISPGFVDSHVHIESSMLVPSEFAKIAVCHGTIGTVSDPHEIANVLGIEGVKFMIKNGKEVPFKFCFGAPSCVPATQFETAGAIINSEGVEDLLKMKEIGYLAEMMNFPGVLYDDQEVISKINIAKKYNKPIDGHAPGISGNDAVKYFSTGISTDHECFTFNEAKEKLELGVKILIREGSAAKNFEALIPLAIDNSSKMMFCSDDKHPDDLIEGHINLLVKRAISNGVNYFDAIRMASLNPIRHYNLNIGLLRIGELADFIVLEDKNNFNVTNTYINGIKVSDNNQSLLKCNNPEILNNFNCDFIQSSDLKIKGTGTKLRIIEAHEGQLVTSIVEKNINAENSEIIPDPSNDILKIVVLNRYSNNPPAIAFIKGFGLKEGAIASSVAHDSHNIVAIGVDDDSICESINLIIREKGGISAVSSNKMGVLALPIAGIMSNLPAEKVADDYKKIDSFAKEILGAQLKSPFMSLSFMALLVIPSLKLSDKGLFDGNTFKFVDLLSK